MRDAHTMGHDAPARPDGADDGPSRAGRPVGTRAIVVGAGVGGLLATRVLADHVDEVVVLDRDQLPASPAHRGGTPQSHHAHALLPRGLEIIHELFPGIGDRLVAAGAVRGADLAQARFVTPRGLLPLSGSLDHSGAAAVFCSRALLEWHLADALRHHPRVEIVPGAEVVGLVARPGRRRAGPSVDGVRVRRRGGDPGTEEILTTDLVVDASGRGSRIETWLDDLGCGPVEVESLTSQLSYVSRFYERPGTEVGPDDFTTLVVQARPPTVPRVGSIIAVEGGRWHVTLGGVGGAAVPTDEAGFLAWTRELADPSVHDALAEGRPAGPLRGWRTPASRWRHVERLRRRPTGLMAVGDAVCSFNPVYAQGMTVAALEALILRDVLRRTSLRDPSVAARFQRRASRVVARAWAVTTLEDLRWPEVAIEGARPPRGADLVRRYLDAVLAAAVEDPVIARRYFAVVAMTAHPVSLASPRVLARVVGRRRAASRPRRTPAAPPVTSARAAPARR